MPLFPREHGAYGQLAFPLATSYAVAGVTVPALLIGAGAIAGFLAHEPLLVLLGRRGRVAPRRRRLEVSPAAANPGRRNGTAWHCATVVRFFLVVWLAAFAVQGTNLLASVVPDGCAEDRRGSATDPCGRMLT